MKRVLITGASSGIGKQLAQDYLSEGWQVLACGRDRGRLQAALGEHDALQYLVFDVTQADTIAEACAQIDAPLDLLILNAGTCEYVDDPMQLDAELFRRVLDTNFTGPLLCTRAMLAHVKSGGRIAYVGSSASLFPFTRAQAYGASKAAVAYFARSMAVDLKAHNIHVTLISPGFVATPLTERNDFDMPMRISTEQASAAIRRDLARGRAHSRPPRKLTTPLSLLGMLPSAWQIALSRRMK